MQVAYVCMKGCNLHIICICLQAVEKALAVVTIILTNLSINRTGCAFKNMYLPIFRKAFKSLLLVLYSLLTTNEVCMFYLVL